MAAFMAFSYCSEEGNYVSSKNAKAFVSIFTHIPENTVQMTTLCSACQCLFVPENSSAS